MKRARRSPATRGVDKITFTGSTAVGKKIVEYSLGDMKRVTLELGGKSPRIVFDDADLDQVGLGAVLAMFFNSGQICFAAIRLFVQDSVYDKVVDAAITGLTHHGISVDDIHYDKFTDSRDQ
ncbi:aldehyde dehydrogenase family protein [Sphingobium scionense]|nr:MULTISPECIES: aldehyde dehydrogenase family protein [Sphingomonadaceae]KFD28067.1 hypothetical protein IH86_11655 [Sphingobium yanoikuyae]MBB4149577.1 acyl-CoA reductase-like NAD-dependent aldehyde dehydrogenase [Sphingobium scionense]TKV44046.1 hypothetical protein A0U87_10175 [Sphingobium sp. MP9-4]HUD94780.1 aldehyde dehydrogenase family protein [Sphingobium sp.]